MNTDSRITTSTGRNHLIAWVDVSIDDDVRIGYVHFPADISDEALATAERHIRDVCVTAARIAFRKGGDKVRKGIKTALEI